MSYKYWLLFSSLALGATHTVACSSKFSSCEARRTCPSGGASGTAGTAGGGTDGGEAGASEGGSAGVNAQGGEAGTTSNAGGGGVAGDSNVDTELEIAVPALALGKTYVPFAGKISASGAAQYTWSITNGTLPAGLALQGAQSATVTIAGIPSEAGQFPISLSVTDGSTTKTVDVTLTVTHSALFLSDRASAGAHELFLAEIGAYSESEPVRLGASLPSGGSVTSYAWSPDGSKVMYLATQSAGGAPELWVASLATPGTAQRVSAVGVTVSRLAWLKAGNIAAYSTSVGDVYLADLSGAAPAPSKLAVAGQGTPAIFVLSPNGRSLLVTVTATTTSDVSLITWTSEPTTVPLLPKVPGGGGSFSFDGRFAMIPAGSGAVWVDTSLPTPIIQSGGLSHGALFAWSPNSDVLLAESGASGYEVSRHDFTSGSLTATVLVPSSLTCPRIDVRPWSPDGKNGLFACGNDVRGIGNVATATVNTDFSLLPSGFLSNSFTDTYDVGWSPDSKWIALRADRDVDTRYDLHLIRWSAPGTAYKPHSNTIGSGVSTWAFGQNSQTVAFVGSIAPQSNAGLYLTTLPATGAPPSATLVSSPAAAVVQTDINWLPGSRVLTYRATVAGAAQLFAVPVAADGTAGTPISISGPSGSGVTSYQLAPTR